MLGNLKQGKRRLKRAYTNVNITSTDGDDVATFNSMPVMLSNAEVEKQLDDMESTFIPQTEEIETNEEKPTKYSK